MSIHTDQYRLAGQLVGSYRTLALLGEGGMGRVYLAEHVRLGRKVALKRLKRRIAERPEAVKQFIAEAQAVNRIRHPHIVDVTDFINDEDGVYYVMEHLEGSTLSAALRESGPFPPARVLNLGHQVADALVAAHGAGVVHLDIKPSNIFLTRRDGQDDYAKLLDFGLAGLLTTLNEPGAAADAAAIPLGTPAYMSPEHISGRAVDHRADLYSLGCVLYEALSGEPPFSARSGPEFVHKHANVRPSPLTHRKDLPHRIPARCARLVMRCLEKDPADRPQSAAALRDELAGVARSTAELRLRPGQAPTVARRPPSRRKLFAAIGGLLAVGVVGAVAYFLSLDKTTARQSPPRAGGATDAGSARPRPMPAVASRKARLRIRSTPPGAQVFRVDQHEVLLGITPLTVQVPRRNEALRLELRLHGFRTVDLTVDLNRAKLTRDVTLEKVAKVEAMGSVSSPRTAPTSPRAQPVRPREPPVRPRVIMDRGGTIDPFGGG